MSDEDQPMTVEQLIKLLRCFVFDHGPDCKVTMMDRGHVYAIETDDHKGKLVAVLWHR